MSTKKKTAKMPARGHVRSLSALLGLPDAEQFELLDRVFTAKPLTLGDQMQLAKALEDAQDSLGAQAVVLTKFLNDRMEVGAELTIEDVRDGVDLRTAQELLRLLQGFRRAAPEDEADEGK